MDIEEKIELLEKRFKQMDQMLEEKTKENEDLKSQVRDLSYENIKLREKLRSDRATREDGIDQSDIEYGQRLARSICDKIRSDEQ